MNLRPMRGYVLVEEADDTETRSSGLIMPETAKDKPIKGKVLAVSNLFNFDGDIIILKEGATLTKEYSNLEGKTVIYKRWSTTDLEEEGKKLSFVAFQDILGVYE